MYLSPTHLLLSIRKNDHDVHCVNDDELIRSKMEADRG